MGPPGGRVTPESWPFWAAVVTLATEGLGALVLAVRTLRAARQNNAKLDEIRQATNSMKIALLAATLARGQWEGRAGDLFEAIEAMRVAETPAAAAAATERLQILLDQTKAGPPPGG